MMHLRAACGVMVLDRMRKYEDLYERCRMAERVERVKFEEVEWVERNTLKWYGNTKIIL